MNIYIYVYTCIICLSLYMYTCYICMYIYTGIYIYIICARLLLGTTLALHAICNAQGLSRLTAILSATFGKSAQRKNTIQGSHKTCHRSRYSSAVLSTMNFQK